jgi:Roadblock/LC7 domain-containing protein
MRSLEPWVDGPLAAFLAESGARLTLLMTSSGQVVAQHGFTRSLDVMSAAALGAGIMAATSELARVMGTAPLDSVTHQGRAVGLYLAAFGTPRGRWLGLVVYGGETSLGLVQLFFARMAEDLGHAVPAEQPPRQVLAENFEDELNRSLRSLFGR